MQTINWRAQVDNHWCEQDEGGEREKIAVIYDVYLM